MYSHQYGFRRGHSTAQAIGQLNNWALEAIDGGKVTGLLFVDISKAFDPINHKVLLGKPEHMGLSRRAVRWFTSYLTDRRESVWINGETLETRQIALGVPQGSILGPMLFNIYINSLPKAVEKSRLIIVRRRRRFFFTASEPLEFQDALGRDYSLISKWYTDNRLTLNVKKTKLMLAGSKTMLSKFENFEFLPDGGQINRVNSFKYLGVTVDEKWIWKCHIKTLLRKLGHRLSVFNRISHMLDRRTRMAYFNGLVLPHCDYADIVWGDQPGLKFGNGTIAGIPKSFCKED